MDQRDKNALMNAVVSGTFTKVESAFNEHNLVFDDSYFDYKLLQAGLHRKHLSILQFLINKIGCRAGNPNKVKLEETPLHLAMKLDNEYYIKKLLSKGALIFDKNESGEVPLHAGFKNANFKAVNALLTHCKPNCKPKDKDAILHFHIACATNHISAAKHYLKCGINPNNPFSIDSEEYSGLNPVHFAAEKNYELFQILVSHGADLSIKNSKGLTPLHIVYYTSSTEDRKSRIKQTFKNGNHTKFINSVDSNRVSHFHLSCMLSELDFVEVFINNGVNVNSSISSKCTVNPCFTPLHFAVMNGCEKVIELLLKSGADCNNKDKDGKTPLHFTYKILDLYWKMPVINMLLDYKASPDTMDKEGNTPVHMEFSYMDSENKNILDALFSKIARKINFTNDEGLSHFHIACTTNNTSLVKDFLASGVDVDGCVTLGMYSGYTALHFAASHNQKDVVKLLLKKKAQVNVKTKEFQVTPLHLACEFSYSKFREENPNYKSNFISYLIHLDTTSNRTNQLDIINLLLVHGAHVDAKDFRGMTPLLHACLIEKNYCKLNWSYNSSMHLTRLEREGLLKEIITRLKEIIEILLCNKANVVVCSDKQESILHIISKYKFIKIPENLIKLILTKGMDIDAVDSIGLTPLHVAVSFDNKRMARILLRNKANVNIKCEDSKIPLHTVFKKVLTDRSERDMFCALLENDSDVNITSGKEGEVLLHHAIDSKNNFIVEKLLHYGSDINYEDSMGNSCVSPLFRWEDKLPGGMAFEEFFYAEVFETVYIHVQKLLALGLYVSKKVRKCCNQLYPYHKAVLLRDDDLINLDNIFGDCVKELQKMKLIKIDSYTSLHSILLKDPHELSKYVRNKNVIKAIKARKLEDDFPLYSFLLKLQVKKGSIRSDLLQSAKTSLTTVLNTSLPDLCLDLIIKYLRNEDVANLKVAAHSRKALKRKLEENNSNRHHISTKLKKDDNPREERLCLRNRALSRSSKQE